MVAGLIPPSLSRRSTLTPAGFLCRSSKKETQTGTAATQARFPEDSWRVERDLVLLGVVGPPGTGIKDIVR